MLFLSSFLAVKRLITVLYHLVFSRTPDEMLSLSLSLRYTQGGLLLLKGEHMKHLSEAEHVKQI